jgi:hypothetical protein
VIGALVVAVHGTINRIGVAGTSARRGSLANELDDALAGMRKLRSR